ncbi:MAG: Unknown protein [uncultured Sulfurovum sp.]|uniref:Uncharacterized protein n=1 Tax=uncultured Sulfurovum sp. TaxID=269237 RepID=A0A6S6TAG1_9BACT|nr:MAG: Unknown protein [uncultured Sulfurovum sp.]
MGQDRELNQVNIIQNALSGYVGFTSGEKKYFSANLSEWVSEDKNLDLLISKSSEISLDVRPFLKQNGLLV